MKKSLKVVLIVLGIIIFLTIVDLVLIFTINRPLLAIKVDDTKYSGIFYNTYNCEELSSLVIKSKFTKFACVVNSLDQEKQIKEIVDKTQEIDDFVCAEALENFYTDTNYRYYYSCIKSNYIVVRYEDGSEETVSDALKNGRISIEDLDNYEITYYKYDIDE